MKMLYQDSQNLFVQVQETNEVGAITKAIYLVDGEPVDEQELKYLNFKLGIITSDFQTAN
jgi:phosphoglycolate phosphatase-like HAD superfamily hydrolase